MRPAREHARGEPAGPLGEPSRRDGPRNVQPAAAISTASSDGAPRQPRCSHDRRPEVDEDLGDVDPDGQTSKQAPHSDDAKGSDAVCASTGCSAMPRSWGVRIAPIGPG